MQSRHLRTASLLSLALFALSAAAAIVCLCIFAFRSTDAERLYRTWQFSRFLFFSTLCLFFAVSLTLDAISKRVSVARNMMVSRRASRIPVLLFCCAMVVVLLYPPRPFVYLENGHWINRSKAGTWEVSRPTAIDSYKRNIVWDCMLVLPVIVGSMVSIAVTLSRAPNPAKPQ